VPIPGRRRRPFRSVALLLGLSLVAGVLTAGLAFPGALALGLVSDDAGDSLNSVPSDLSTGQLPQTSTITDASGRGLAGHDPGGHGEPGVG
jgi:hypothetical protein